MESAFLASLPEKLGGAICMQYNRERGEGHFLWTHTTASMGIGFQVPYSRESMDNMIRIRSRSIPVVIMSQVASLIVAQLVER